MMIRIPCFFAALVFSAFVLTGCKSPQTYFYTLSSTVDPMAAAEIPVHSPVAVGIGPVSVAGYVDRPEIIIRDNAHAVELQDYRQWAEPLVNGLPAVLTRNIAALLPADHVDSYPQTTPTPLAFRVQVEITRFDLSRSGEATLTARWQIFDAGTGRFVLSRTSTMKEQAADAAADAGVGALSRTLGKLAAEIAVQLAMLAGVP